jgi:hypothetical protein
MTIVIRFGLLMVGLEAVYKEGNSVIMAVSSSI